METSAAASPPSSKRCLLSLFFVGSQRCNPADLKEPTKISVEVRLVGKDADGSCGAEIYAQLRGF